MSMDLSLTMYKVLEKILCKHIYHTGQKCILSHQICHKSFILIPYLKMNVALAIYAFEQTVRANLYTFIP